MNSGPQGDRASHSGAPFRLPALQPTIFVALALVFVWVIRPTGNDWLKIPFLVVLVSIPFASNFLHRDRLRDLGLRFDNFAASAREVGIATLVGALAILLIGFVGGSAPAFQLRTIESLLVYPVWGLVQQYAMQAFTYRRLREGTGGGGIRAAGVGTASLFAIVHYPNTPLIVGTLLGGYVWCRLFERNPNLFTLAVSHGWLAVLLRASWPAEWLHNLRIGPSYWSWTP